MKILSVWIKYILCMLFRRVYGENEYNKDVDDFFGDERDVDYEILHKNKKTRGSSYGCGCSCDMTVINPKRLRCYKVHFVNER